VTQSRCDAVPHVLARTRPLFLALTLVAATAAVVRVRCAGHRGCTGDVRAHVAQVLHARDADAVQRRHAAAADVVVLPCADEGECGGCEQSSARGPVIHALGVGVYAQDDSIEGIFDTLKTCACISKYAGGIGLSVHNIRATGSHIRGTNGTSNGLVPMLRVFSDTARYVDQGGGKRKGSIAVYLEPWHADVEGEHRACLPARVFSALCRITSACVPAVTVRLPSAQEEPRRRGNASP
jgi:hypothetical protein